MGVLFGQAVENNLYAGSGSICNKPVLEFVMDVFRNDPP
jgi:hypothetical protein